LGAVTDVGSSHPQITSLFLYCMPCWLQAQALHTEAAAVYALSGQLSQLQKL
jgi:hypothetical protein